VKEKAINHAENATVALLHGKRGEREAYCAGVWVDNKTILTAAHCVEMAGKNLMELTPSKEHNPIGDVITFINRADIINIDNDVVWIGVVDQYDKEKDLATIMPLGSTSPHDVVDISQDDIRMGQSFHIIGHPLGMVWSYTQGYVATTRKVEGPNNAVVKTIQISAPIWFGNSGGGSFNSKGQLTGICSWINVRAPNVSFFVHKEEILEFLKTRKFNLPI
jgi:S1-C subfamily serine protease